MSLTSYRAAPPRDTVFAHVVGVCLGTRGLIREKGRMGPFARGLCALTCEWVFPVPAGFNAWRRPTLPTLER